SSPAIGGALSILIVTIAWFTASMFLKQTSPPEATLNTTIEFLLFAAILFGPVFLGCLWLSFAPVSLGNFGLMQLEDIFVGLVTLQLAFFLDEKTLKWTARAGLVIYVASIVADFLTKGVI